MLVLGSHMVVKAGAADDLSLARTMLEESLSNGRAFEVFKEFVRAQGGDPNEAEHPELLPAARFQETVPAPGDGYVADIATEEIGKICLLLGGGRETKESRIDLSVGLVLCKKKGDAVRKGEPLAVIHANDEELLGQAAERLASAYTLTEMKPEAIPLIKEVIS